MLQHSKFFLGTIGAWLRGLLQLEETLAPWDYLAPLCIPHLEREMGTSWSGVMCSERLDT